MAERAEPAMSTANPSWPRSSAAWIALALVLSRYAGAVVAKASERGRSPLRKARRAASTPIVVVSSS